MDNYTKHIGKLPPPVELPFADIAKLAARSEEVEIMSEVAQRSIHILTITSYASTFHKSCAWSVMQKMMRHFLPDILLKRRRTEWEYLCAGKADG